jgi:RNA polymerase sigma factor (sigma-70 family)
MKCNEKKNEEVNSLLHNYYETLKNFPPLSKEEERVLLKKYKEENDFVARQKLITSNLRYALKYVIKYNNKNNVPLEDLIEEANMGLIKAVDEYDLNNENRIITYANWKMLFNLQEATKNNVENNAEDYQLNSASNDKEEDSEEQHENNIIHENLVCDDNFYTSENEKNKQNRQCVEILMEELGEREYDMISMYYGVNDYKKETTLAEIGGKYGLTKERVRQIIDKTKRKMRIKALVENINYL